MQPSVKFYTTNPPALHIEILEIESYILIRERGCMQWKKEQK
jgi:hypothetical protein